MKKTTCVFSLLLFVTVYCQFTRAQTTSDMEREVKYRSPVRYVIVYNDIFDDLNERRLVVLIDRHAFNRSNLISVISLIKKRFPDSLDLTIDFETDLVLIESPEERELLRDGEDSRFSRFYYRYKRASYSRFASGREAMTYTTSITPYRERTFVIVDKPVP